MNDPGYETRVKPPEAKKTAAKKVETSQKRVGRTAVERQIEDVEQALEENFTIIFGFLGGVAPVTSVYGVENSPAAIHALTNIAKRRPAVMKGLLFLADGANSMELAKFLGGLVVALQVDAGRIAPDSLPARSLGVTAVIEKHFMPDTPNDVPNPAMTSQAPHGIRFDPVP